jgi:hypothetical protein
MPYWRVCTLVQNHYALADLNPKTLAAMHGSTFVGDGRRALQDLHALFREVFGGA